MFDLTGYKSVGSTGLRASAGFSKDRQERILRSALAKKKQTISAFMKRQVSVVLFWLRVISWLDSQGTSWTLTLVSRKYSLDYFLQCSHRVSKKHVEKWTIEYDMKKRPNPQGRHKKLQFDNATAFYELFLFCLVRIPKGHIMIEMFTINNRPVLEMETRWDLQTIRDHMVRSGHPAIAIHAIDAHPLPMHTGATVSTDDFLVSYLNAGFQQKRRVLEPHSQ